jgi:hypothetical protein
MTPNAKVAGYVLVFSDEDYDAVFPTTDAVPRVLYPSAEAAVNAVQTWAKTFDRFRPVLYGQAYPYENTSFVGELAKTGRALYGWAEMEDEDGETTRFGLCVTALFAA